jgi:aspartyl aminopeptidase
MKKRVVILSSQEDIWEACYVDGKCIDQNHHLGEGYGKIHFLKKLSKDYGVTLDDVVEIDAEWVDDQEAMDCGEFPEFLSELKGTYNVLNEEDEK